MIPETDERKRIMAEKTNVEAENEFASIKAAKLKGVDGDKLIVVDFRNAVNPDQSLIVLLRQSSKMRKLIIRFIVQWLKQIVCLLSI